MLSVLLNTARDCKETKKARQGTDGIASVKVGRELKSGLKLEFGLKKN